MKNIDVKIKTLKDKIEVKEKLINRYMSNQEEYKEWIEIEKKEILALKRKVIILEENKKTGIYIPKKPELGDDRYKNFEEKNELDVLRVLYYDFFGKDPSLSLVRDWECMFYDPTLPIYTSTYLIRGEVPFNVMYTANYQDYKPNDKYSIGIKFDRKDLVKDSGTKYLELMLTLIKRYSNNEVNLICGDAMNETCTLAYIGDFGFSYYHLNRERNERMYYDFFDRLCDNNWRNIAYIGDTMKQNSKLEEIEKVDSKIVPYHLEEIAKNLGMTIEELIESNRKLTEQVLSLSRK